MAHKKAHSEPVEKQPDNSPEASSESESQQQTLNNYQMSSTVNALVDDAVYLKVKQHAH